jgi:protein transport protein SEC23
VTYAAAVAAYDVSVTTGVATAEVLPGTKSPTPEDVRDLMGGGRKYVAPLEECAGSVDAVLSSLRPFSVGSVRRRPRCLGAALETAVALLRDAMGGVGGGRVVVCASGPATRGPGGVAADEDSELFDFEEKAAKDYVDELSITVSHDDTQLESRPNFPRHARFFLVQHHTEVR